MPLLAVGIVLLALLLAWAGVEVNDLVNAYPGQFLAGVICVLIVAFAGAVARFRKANEKVTLTRDLRPRVPEMPPAVVVKPLAATPVLKAIACPGHVGARDCEGSGCGAKVDDDPWTITPPGEVKEHVFCSERCARSWSATWTAASR